MEARVSAGARRVQPPGARTAHDPRPGARRGMATSFRNAYARGWCPIHVRRSSHWISRAQSDAARPQPSRASATDGGGIARLRNRPSHLLGVLRGGGEFGNPETFNCRRKGHITSIPRAATGASYRAHVLDLPTSRTFAAHDLRTTPPGLRGERRFRPASSARCGRAARFVERCRRPCSRR